MTTSLTPARNLSASIAADPITTTSARCMSTSRVRRASSVSTAGKRGIPQGTAISRSAVQTVTQLSIWRGTVHRWSRSTSRRFVGIVISRGILPRSVQSRGGVICVIKLGMILECVPGIGRIKGWGWRGRWGWMLCRRGCALTVIRRGIMPISVMSRRGAITVIRRDIFHGIVRIWWDRYQWWTLSTRWVRKKDKSLSSEHKAEKSRNPSPLWILAARNLKSVNSISASTWRRQRSQASQNLEESSHRRPNWVSRSQKNWRRKEQRKRSMRIRWNNNKVGNDFFVSGRYFYCNIFVL